LTLSILFSFDEFLERFSLRRQDDYHCARRSPIAVCEWPHLILAPPYIASMLLLALQHIMPRCRFMDVSA
jgi:hypothetical protein